MEPNSKISQDSKPTEGTKPSSTCDAASGDSIPVAAGSKPKDSLLECAFGTSQQFKQGGDNLEDLFSTLKQQISSSDWLEKNTADKWVKENPELAKDFMEAAEKS